MKNLIGKSLVGIATLSFALVSNGSAATSQTASSEVVKAHELSSEPARFSVGALLGAGDTSGTSGLNTAIHWGAGFAYAVSPAFRTGLDFTFKTANIEGSSLDLTWMMVMPTFEWTAGGFHAGAKLGLAEASVSSGPVRVSTTSFGVGPTLGYDFRLSRLFSLGLQAEGIFLTEGANDNWTYSGLSAFRFWF